MAKHTQTNELFECVWPFYGIGAKRVKISNLITVSLPSLSEKYPYSEFFWSVFSRIRTEYGEIWTRKTANTDTFYAVFYSCVVDYITTKSV